MPNNTEVISCDLFSILSSLNFSVEDITGMEAGLQPRLMCTFSVVIPLKATGHCAEKILTPSGERCQ
ncbi:hypothetical protein CPR06_08565 [Salmonella enterica subsp. enterica serovar Typhimurium]|uniref:Uncharacterized protein n=1 Tax=Salmonella typhimurium TaxID=90371 RepID=A0A734EVU4_SALTM|nr:hypothetical protein [Salmonella enterica subsp. enterica serovar Typhimurium]ECQ9395569.1 hypothetical protein [Salmonella enterica subsp. enterica]ECY5998175.1 hypothetical protein [Salmonella enterica subsp. enterica serovar Indiana]EDV0471904.1 hypothetical protein [Salmonella enterica subsp. enterica serovar Stanleyville]EDZ6976172.1 hypothetical protein [Salmonella enterica]EFF0242359.1 hypothetical protein [Escherichia coli]TKC65813.1 hypothetical protein FAZ93_09375 [Salmonella ent